MAFKSYKSYFAYLILGDISIVTNILKKQWEMKLGPSEQKNINAWHEKQQEEETWKKKGAG